VHLGSACEINNEEAGFIDNGTSTEISACCHLPAGCLINGLCDIAGPLAVRQSCPPPCRALDLAGWSEAGRKFANSIDHSAESRLNLTGGINRHERICRQLDLHGDRCYNAGIKLLPRALNRNKA
jgi:hypothetical protein